MPNLLPWLTAACILGCLHAQQPAFDVASVKPSAPVTGDFITIDLGSVRHGQLTMGNVSLSDCLRFAYGLSSDQQLSGPDWITSKAIRFDIDAKAPPETPLEQIESMLQTLLTERFHLVTHRDSKVLAHFALVPARNGPKLQPAGPDGPEGPSSGNRIAGRSIDHRRMSMENLATLLSRFELHAPVLDRTGLTGLFQVKLEWIPDSGANPEPNADSPAGPSLYTAIQEQLGLKLEERKGPVEILVVDRADQVPTEN